MERIETSYSESKHYSASRMLLREKHESVRFMIIVKDPRKESTREIIKVSRDVTEATPLSYSERAPIELVPRRGLVQASCIETDQDHLCCQRLNENKKPLIVEVVESRKKTRSVKRPRLKKTKSKKSPMLSATRLLESSARKTTGSLETTSFLRYVLQNQMWNK